MTDFDGQEVRIPLRLDTSQLESDLRTASAELQRLERQAQRIFNQNPLVGKSRSSLYMPAQSIEDVRANIKGLSQSQLQQFDPRLAQALRQLDQYSSAITAQARAGRGVLPQTEQQAARSRLQQIERANQSRPTQIDFSPSGWDKFKRIALQAGPNLGAAAAARGGVGNAWSLGRLLSGLATEGVLGEFAGPAAALAAELGVAAAANQNSVAFQRQQASLASALVGGPLLGNRRALMGLAVNAAGKGLDFDQGTSQRIASQLALAGVGRSDLLGNLSNTLMLAGPSGINPSDVVGLTGALATAGGMSSQDINRLFQDTDNIASDARVSLQELLQSMKTLSTGATTAARDVGSLAAIQHLVGASSGISAGALMQGVMSSTGTAALQQAGLLGMSPEQFYAAQTQRGGMATIYDRVAGLVRSVDRGPAGRFAAEQLLTSTNLLNAQSLSPAQLGGLIDALRTAPPGQAERLAQQYTGQANRQAVSQAESYRRAAQSMDTLTTATDRAGIAVQDWWTALINTPGGNPVLTNLQKEMQASQTRATAWTYTQTGLGYPTSTPISIPDIYGGRVQISGAQLAWARAASQRSGIPLGTLLEQLAAETPAGAGRLVANAVSAKGAIGVGQFTPATIRGLSTASDVPASTRRFFQHFDPRNAQQSIQAMALYDQYLYQKYGSLPDALNAYNSGSPTAGYGVRVVEAGQTINVNVTVTDRTTGGVNATVDKGRTVKGHVTHGPPAIPHRRG